MIININSATACRLHDISRCLPRGTSTRSLLVGSCYFYNPSTPAQT
jgi:hypothetical protein